MNTYDNARSLMNLALSIKLKLNFDGQAEPVPRVAIFFPARHKIWACARPPTEKCAVQIGTELLRHGTSHMVSGLRAMPAQRANVP